ncbi:hypothetical protein E2320_009908, partial [Naja naja]
RNHDHWIPIIIVIMVTALVSYLTKATNVELATGRKRLAFTADIQSLKRQEKMRKRRARPAIKGCPLKCTKLGREGRREERISSPTKAN